MLNYLLGRANSNWKYECKAAISCYKCLVFSILMWRDYGTDWEKLLWRFAAIQVFFFFFFSNMRRPIRSVGQKQSQHRGLAWEHWVPSHLYYLTPSPCKSISSNENWYALPGGSCKTNSLSVPHLTQLTANPRFICRIAHAAIEWEGLRNCHQDLEYSVILAVFPLSLSASCVLFLFAFILSAYFVFLVWWTWP